MKGLLLAGLLSGVAQIRAHPHAGPESGARSGLARRTVDLNAFRLVSTTEYVNQTETASNTTITNSLFKRESYVDTATELVKATFPDLTFRTVGDNYVGSNGIGHVNFKQTVHGLDVDNADFNVNIGKDGKVFSFGNSFYTGTLPAANPLVKREHVDAVAALKGATNILQLPVKADAASAEPVEGQETYTLKGTSGAVKDPEARLVYFRKGDGNLALTWRVETDILDNWLLTYIDAATNEQVHGVVDWSADASYQVYPWGVNDPNEGSRVTVSNPWDTKASEFGWQSDGTTTYTVPRGNNGIAQVNPTGGNTYLNNYRPTNAAQNFVYPYSPATTSPTSYRDASITQLFYTANMYHDVLYKLGFTEVAGNFEINNNKQGGAGNDFVVLNAQDGSGTNNANFATPPDGQIGRMRMYLWTLTTPQRDCTFEAGVVIHEYTHGVSNRLTGGPANANCLSDLESGGMGEGWGDFMATAIRLKASDTRATNYPLGAWISGDPKGIRSYLYSTSLTTNPLTYTSLNTLNEVHDIGEMWANVLYEVMWNLIDKHGKSTATFPTLDSNGVPTDGKFLAMKLVLDGMALQPCLPNMIQARSAIIDADTNLTGGANKCAIWTAFAKRGLGSGAAYSSTRRTGSTTIPAGVC